MSNHKVLACSDHQGVSVGLPPTPAASRIHRSEAGSRISRRFFSGVPIGLLPPKGDEAQIVGRGPRRAADPQVGAPLWWLKGRGVLILCLIASAPVFAQEAAPKEKIEKLAPYYPTPQMVVEKMLQLTGLKSGERMYDLGSGDGRIVIMAAQKFQADAYGIEFDADLVFQSNEKIKKLGLKNAHIVHGDILKQDYGQADVITVYLLPISNDKIRPLLDKQLKKGTRIVAHDFEIADWTPVKVVDIDDDGEGRSHRLFLYQK